MRWHKRKRKPLHRLIAWGGLGMAVAGIALCARVGMGHGSSKALALGCGLFLVGTVLGFAALLADEGDGDPPNPTSMMGTGGGA